MWSLCTVSTRSRRSKSAGGRASGAGEFPSGYIDRLGERFALANASASRFLKVQEQVAGHPWCTTEWIQRYFRRAKKPLPAAPVILSVGNLIPIKGHEVLIRAVAALVAEFPELTLDIIGRGPEQSRLQTLAQQLGIGHSVRFLGQQSRQQVAAAMRQCTVFALPSRYEGLGCVYLEAMSAGKPVIGCRGQGIAEIIHHGSNGFLVGPDNEKELALALAMLLRDEPRRRSLGAAARDTILDRLTLEQQAESLARIYRESAG